MTALFDSCPQVLFAGPQFPAARENLLSVRPDALISYLPTNDLRDVVCSTEVLVPLMAKVDRPFLERASGLRLVQQWGAGLEGVDCEAASELGIAVGNVPTSVSRNADAVAEWCVMAALVLSRQLPDLEQVIRSGSSWGSPMGRSLVGKTAGIIGLGGIGNALARRLAPFEMDRIGITRQPNAERATALGLRWLGGPDELGRLLAESDYVFLCVPLAPQTTRLIDSSALQLLRPNACLINPGRGGLIDEEALAREIATGRLMSAALDVFTSEPLDPDHELLQHRNVLATPHIAGVTDRSYRGIADEVAVILERLARREPLEHCVNWADVGATFY